MPGGSGIVVEVVAVDDVVLVAAVAGAAAVGGVVRPEAARGAITAEPVGAAVDAAVVAADRFGAGGCATAASTPTGGAGSAIRDVLQLVTTTSQAPNSAQARLRFTAETVLLIPPREWSPQRLLDEPARPTERQPRRASSALTRVGTRRRLEASTATQRPRRLTAPGHRPREMLQTFIKDVRQSQSARAASGVRKSLVKTQPAALPK